MEKVYTGEKIEGAADVAKSIRFTYGGKNYILEFTRASVRQMERGGFDANEVPKRPLVMLPELFAGAFIANHPLTGRRKIDCIFAKLDEKDELLDALVWMLNGVYEEILAEFEAADNGLKWRRE